MKYYSEEEVNRVLRPIVDYYVLDHAIQKMQSTILPTIESSSSDRERIRMELWKETYLHYTKNGYGTNITGFSVRALEAFDKQFPNS